MMLAKPLTYWRPTASCSEQILEDAGLQFEADFYQGEKAVKMGAAGPGPASWQYCAC